MKSDAVLVDTSVFIDFLRGDGKSENVLPNLLTKQYVILSRYVRLELLMGVRKNERRTLADLLDALPYPKPNLKLFDVAETLIVTVRQGGLSSGLVDFLIVLEALQLQVPLYTYDKVMSKIASSLGVIIFKD